jgi:phage anti-repressor protein
MTNNIVPIKNDVSTLLDQWLEAEQNGEQFPVPFDDAWKMAGYSNKANAKRALLDLTKGEDFSSVLMNKPSSNASKVSRSQYIKLTCDAFKSFCLMAKTNEGKMTRAYFIDAEKKWKLTQQIAPQVASEVEMMHLKIELAKVEAQSAIAQKNLLDTRKAITDMGNQTLSALILGATVITDKTPVERIIDNASGRVFEGVGITAIAKKLGFKNTKDCWQWLESIGYGKDSNHWDLQLSAVEHHKLQPDAYDEILARWNQGVRQRFIGE